MSQLKVEGLSALITGLKRTNRDLPKQLRVAMNTAVSVVVDDAKSRIPRRTGRAAASLRAASTQRVARISAGGPRAPHYPWLDFGGRTGRARSVVRPFYREGRYIYPALARRREQFERMIADALVEVARAGGIEVE